MINKFKKIIGSGCLTLTTIIFVLLVPIFVIVNYVRRKLELIKILRKVLPTMAKQNKKMLFAYSNSPIYKDYVENTIIPMIKEKAIIFNWSERKKWDNDDDFVRLFRNLHRNVRWGKSGFVPFLVVPESKNSVKVIKLPDLPKEGLEQIETLLLETT